MLSDSQVVLGLAVKELCGTDNQIYIILALTTTVNPIIFKSFKTLDAARLF